MQLISNNRFNTPYYQYSVSLNDKCTFSVIIQNIQRLGQVAKS